MDTQTLLTVAAVVGPLVGVALGAFLASRLQESHWFRDRRLDAFVAAQTAVYRVIAAALYLANLGPPKRKNLIAKQLRLEATTSLREAATQWGEARERLDLLAGASVVRTTGELHEILRAMASAATRNDRTDWDPRMAVAQTLRTRLTDEMRKELKIR